MTVPCKTVTITAPTPPPPTPPPAPVYPDVEFGTVDGNLEAFRTVLIAGTGNTNVSIRDTILILDESLTGYELSSVSRTLAPGETLASTVNIASTIETLRSQGLIGGPGGRLYSIYQRITGWFGRKDVERIQITVQ